MAQLVNELNLVLKTKVGQSEGYTALLFVDGKFKQIIEKPLNCDKGTKVVYISSLTHNLLWGTREKLCFKKDDNLFHIGFSGKIDIQINNPRKFYNEIVLNYKQITVEQLQKIIVPVTVESLDYFLHKYIVDNNLKITEIEVNKSELARQARLEISKKLEYSYGITCKNFSILNVLIDNDEFEKIQVQTKVLKKKSQELQPINTNKIKQSTEKELEEEMMLE